MSQSDARDLGRYGSRKNFTLTRIAQQLPTYQIAPIEDDTTAIKGFMVVGSNGQRSNGVLSFDEASRKLLSLQQDQMRQLDIYQSAGLQAGAQSMPRKYSQDYCMKTSCAHMGFSQKASCRPQKNCYK